MFITHFFSKNVSQKWNNVLVCKCSHQTHSFIYISINITFKYQYNTDNYWPRWSPDSRFEVSNSGKVDGFFQDAKILSTNPLRGISNCRFRDWSFSGSLKNLTPKNTVLWVKSNPVYSRYTDTFLPTWHLSPLHLVGNKCTVTKFNYIKKP